MYLIECISAYIAATQMQQKEMGYQTAYALLRVKRELQTQIDFFRDEELKLIKKYARTDENGQIQWLENERFAFEDTASAEEFKREREKLCMTQTDEPETLHAPIPERISPAQLEALEKFIRFGEE
jgi:hypothetical protein